MAYLGPYQRAVGTSAANMPQTVSTPTGQVIEVVSVHVAYSNTPTQTGVVYTLDAGEGAAYDTVVQTDSANARYGNYIPNNRLRLGPDDQLDVLAPAGGGSLTSSVMIIYRGVYDD